MAIIVVARPYRSLHLAGCWQVSLSPPSLPLSFSWSCTATFPDLPSWGVEGGACNGSPHVLPSNSQLAGQAAWERWLWDGGRMGQSYYSHRPSSLSWLTTKSGKASVGRLPLSHHFLCPPRNWLVGGWEGTNLRRGFASCNVNSSTVPSLPYFFSLQLTPDVLSRTLVLSDFHHVSKNHSIIHCL